MRYFTLLGLLSFFVLFNSCSEEDEPFTHPLQTAESNLGTWTWYDVDGMYCRDGSATGLVTRMNDPKKLVIYINGGGACYNQATCASNPSSFTEENAIDLLTTQGNPGIFNNERTENPVKDWSFVFIPYCTGDVHSGRNEDGRALDVPGNQMYVGNYNFINAMEFIAPYFLENDVEEILFFGLSAGGFGVYINALELEEFFPGIKKTIINDSGPLFKDEDAFSVCLQLGFNFIFNLPIPADFLYCCDNLSLGNVYEYAATKYPNYNYGFTSSLEDEVIRFFLGFGQNTCSSDEILPAPVFRSAIQSLRDDHLIPGGKWSTFLIDSDSHTLLASDNKYYDRPIDGIYLYDWVQAVINGEVMHLSE